MIDLDRVVTRWLAMLMTCGERRGFQCSACGGASWHPQAVVTHPVDIEAGAELRWVALACDGCGHMEFVDLSRVLAVAGATTPFTPIAEVNDVRFVGSAPRHRILPMAR